ncbi:MAG: hypothetical protein ACYC96_00155 [Fimbriimonadaceae bacterium]
MKNLRIISLAILALAAVSVVAQTPTRGFQGRKGTSMHGRYGGGMYLGAPTLDVTAAMVRAGGGASDFSIKRALVVAAGKDWATSELSHLNAKYGAAKMRRWTETFNFAVTDSQRKNARAGVVMPTAHMQARPLAMAMVNAGVDKNHLFTTDLWMDRTESHNVHMKVMSDMDKQYGSDADADWHQVSNRLFYDLALHLNMKQVKLAGFH